MAERHQAKLRGDDAPAVVPARPQPARWHLMDVVAGIVTAEEYVGEVKREVNERLAWDRQYGRRRRVA